MHAEKKYDWYKIADSLMALPWQSNDLCIVEVKGRKITLARWKDQVFACVHQCPHAGGVLADGWLDAAGNIVCPLHKYKFKLESGYNTSGEGYKLKTYSIEQREDGIYVGLEHKGFLNWL